MIVHRIVFVYIFSALIFNFGIFASPKDCKTKTEAEKIEILLKKIGSMEAVFIRNGSKHGPLDAENHLRFKLEEGKKSFFAPPSKDWTALLFIEKIASKSFFTGSPYMIEFSKGNQIKSSDFLKLELKKIESCEN